MENLLGAEEAEEAELDDEAAGVEGAEMVVVCSVADGVVEVVVVAAPWHKPQEKGHRLFIYVGSVTQKPLAACEGHKAFLSRQFEVGRNTAEGKARLAGGGERGGGDKGQHYRSLASFLFSYDCFPCPFKASFSLSSHPFLSF